MGGTGQTGIIGADNRLNPVEQAFVKGVAVNVVLCRLQDALVHGQIVVAGGNNQVGPLDQAVVIDLVMMDQRAARGLGHAESFPVVDPGHGPDMGVEDRRVGQQHFDHLQGLMVQVQNLQNQ